MVAGKSGPGAGASAAAEAGSDRVDSAGSSRIRESVARPGSSEGSDRVGVSWSPRSRVSVARSASAAERSAIFSPQSGQRTGREGDNESTDRRQRQSTEGQAKKAGMGRPPQG